MRLPCPDGGIKTLDQYKKYLQKDTGKRSDQEFAAYLAISDAQVHARWLQLQNDEFAYGSYSMASAVMRAGQRAYLYDFAFGETGKAAPLGAHHGLELNFLQCVSARLGTKRGGPEARRGDAQLLDTICENWRSESWRSSRVGGVRRRLKSVVGTWT
jgi:hypothetical protein